MILLIIAIVSSIGYLSMMAVMLVKLESAMLATLLGHELEELVVDLSIDPEVAMPDTASVKAYLLSRQQTRPIPGYLYNLSSNVYHKLPVEEKVFQVAVVDLGDDRMYLSFDITTLEQHQGSLLNLIIGAGLFSTFILVMSGLWLLRKFLLPISNLADEVASISPTDRNFRFEKKYHDYEVGIIAHSIDQFLVRMDAFVEREQSFTAAVSHELRTPVTVIATATDLLELKGVSSEQKVVIGRIRDSTTYMGNVIEALLFFARDSHQVMEKTLPEIHLHKVFQTVLEGYHEAVSEKKLELVFKRKAKLNVRMAESHLEIILGNLIRNAIANTESGEITVTLFENGFSVEDSGRGIDPNEIEHIVKLNYHSLDSHGFGLGLYLVKNICDIYGLELEIDSTVDKGSRFAIYFPDKVTRGDSYVSTIKCVSH